MNIIENKDCIDGMDNLTENSVDIIVTSPPYKSKDGYSFGLMSLFLNQASRLLKDNSLCFVNFGHLKEDKSRPFEIPDIAKRSGFKLLDTIIWIKNHYTPLPGNNLNNLYEFVFMFCKGDCPKLDRLSIGIPYKDKSNAKRYNNGIDLRCAGNIWYIDIPTINKKEKRLHKDEFPIELPLRCLKLSGLKSGMVLDPFAGSGTTLLAAKQLGLNYIGFEKNKQYYDIAIERLK